MIKTPALPIPFRRLAFGAAVAFLTAIAMTGRVDAQAIVLVNGDPVTQFDIEQRAKLIQLSSRRTPTRNEVVEELECTIIPGRGRRRCAAPRNDVSEGMG